MCQAGRVCWIFWVDQSNDDLLEYHVLYICVVYMVWCPIENIRADQVCHMNFTGLSFVCRRICSRVWIVVKGYICVIWPIPKGDSEVYLRRYVIVVLYRVFICVSKIYSCHWYFFLSYCNINIDNINLWVIWTHKNYLYYLYTTHII